MMKKRMGLVVLGSLVLNCFGAEGLLKLKWNDEAFSDRELIEEYDIHKDRLKRISSTIEGNLASQIRDEDSHRLSGEGPPLLFGVQARVVFHSIKNELASQNVTEEDLEFEDFSLAATAYLTELGFTFLSKKKYSEDLSDEDVADLVRANKAVSADMAGLFMPTLFTLLFIKKEIETPKN